MFYFECRLVQRDFFLLDEMCYYDENVVILSDWKWELKKKKKVNGKNIYILQTLFYISRGPMCATCLALKVVWVGKWCLEVACEPTDLQCFCVRFRETKNIQAWSADLDEIEVICVEASLTLC